MTPIPVYITDCVGDCMVIAHEARDFAEIALRAAVLAGALALVCLGALVMAVGFRR